MRNFISILKLVEVNIDSLKDIFCNLEVRIN